MYANVLSGERIDLLARLSENHTLLFNLFYRKFGWITSALTQVIPEEDFRKESVFEDYC